MRVFYFDSNKLTDKKTEKLLSCSEEYRADRYKKAASESAGRETLCAGFLLRYAVSQYASVPFDSVKSSYGPSGKPVIVSPESVIQLCVSLAHTQGHVFCAVSDTPIGIDAELLRAYDKGLVDRFFGEAEREYLASAENEQDTRARFFEIWTSKEACFKWGMNGMDSFLEADFFAVRKRVTRRIGDLMLTVVGYADLPVTEDVTELSLDGF